ncbi:hypothetical protein AK88_03647 [Plasmodium fragile]|uniref:Uncharacterized protein n=1 Tax=Plasmodium fragile TaxID=5857 RepID=A0A0D9QI42_PLAFR|nr:uncharacterized protein AK88_03647 [Plasmodium fragile]KJP86735.1 hypothetical protein AK88_03647 [Plasmodium fragile]
MDKKKKGKKDKASKKGLRKEKKEDETAGAKLIKTSDWDVNAQTRYIEKDENDDPVPNEMPFTEDVGSEEINGRKMKKEVDKLPHNGNNTNKGRSEMVRRYTQGCKTNNGEEDDTTLSPSNEFKLTNLKNDEIFESNLPKSIGEISPLKRTDFFAAEKGNGFHVNELNKSVQFLEDMKGLKMKKQRMDDLVMNIGNKKENNKGTPNGPDSLKAGTKGEVTSHINIEEKETLSYKLKKQKKIEKYKLSNEEKDKYMKKYMLKLEKQYKKKKDEDLKKEVEEQKEEIKKYQEKENTFLNYLKNPRLNLSKTEDLNDYLCISPTTVYFTDVTKDETMTKDLLITNKGSTLLHVIIVPPSTSHFHIKDIINVYNKNEENSKNNLNNQIAPGHSLKIKIGYSVFTLKHQSDQIKIQSEGGNKTIHIKAFRSIPKIKFHTIFNFGPIRSHEKKKRSFYITNEGEETNVLILPRKLFSFYETQEKIAREENILNLLIKRKEDSSEACQIGARDGAGEIIQVTEKEDTYYTFNNVKSYSQNFLYLYKYLSHNFEKLYFENILQDCYYLNLKRGEEKVVTFAFRSGKIGVYEKDYLIVTDIECDFGELEDKRKCEFLKWNQMNVFPFCVKALVEPLLLNLVHINGNVPGECYERKVAEYLQGGKRDNLSYFFYSSSLHSIRFPDVQVNSGYSVAEVEVLNNGLIDLKVSCSVYVKANSQREEKHIILDKEDKGVYYYNEVFDVACPHLLYDKLAEGKSSPREEERKKGRKGGKKKMCPVYIYPKKFTLSYKKRQKIHIIFRPQEKHENYKNYCFLLVIKNLSKGSDLSIGDLLEIQKNGGEGNGGFPLVCVRENKIIKDKKWNQRFENDISKYEDSSSPEGDTCSSYSEISQDESLKKKQNNMKTYCGKKNKKKKFVAFCMDVYANIVNPNVHVKTKKLTKCLLLNPLHLYETSFTIKNASDFYVNYCFKNLIPLDDLSKGEKGVSFEKNKGVVEGKNTNALKCEEKEKTPIRGGILDDVAESKRKEDDPSADKDACQICYYNYVDVMRDIRLAKKGGEESITESRSRSGRSSSDREKTKIRDGAENRPIGNEVEKNKAVDKTGNTDKGTHQMLIKKNMTGGDTMGEASIPPHREHFLNLNKRVIKYFYERGNSDAVKMYVLVKNTSNEIFKMENEEMGGNVGTLQRQQREEVDGGKKWTKKVKNKSVTIFKVEGGEYCLKPHEKKKIFLYFLVNHYGYHEMNMNIIFYMGKYMLEKKVKARILTKCKGIGISRDSFVFRNIYSHYCFCNMVNIENLDKDLKLLKLGQTFEKQWGFITMYMLYLSAFKNKEKKRSIMTREDLLNHFKRNFHLFLEEEIDKSCVKREGEGYQCDLCRCSFKYDCCIHFFENKFLACTDGHGYSYEFGSEKYIVENRKMRSLMEEPSRCNHLSDKLHGIYKYHADKDLYIHNNKAEFAAHLLMYPSNLLLLPLRETVFLFFVFLPHAGSISPLLSINWNKFRRDILIEGECKNGSVKIKYDKKIGSCNPVNTKRGKNYVGICSDTFHVKVKNLNELDISYKICQWGKKEFEYNYHKKEYVVVWNCTAKLDYYYEDFYTFAKVNNVKREKDTGFFYQSGEELKEEKHSCVKKNSAQYMKEGPLLKGEPSMEEGSKIHGCIITADCHSNVVKGNQSKTHEFRLLIFHDDDTTKDENFVKLKFPVKLNYFHYREVIKVSCYFSRHTFDFVLMREEDLLLSLLSYVKMVVREGRWCEKGATTCVGNETDGEKGMKTNWTDSFVKELMDELDFIKRQKKDDRVWGETINEYFEQMKKFFPPNFDEDVLTEFKKFVFQMESTFEGKEMMCDKMSTNEKHTNDVDGTQEEEKPVDEIIHQGSLRADGHFSHDKGEHTNRKVYEGVEKFVWVHKLVHGLNNKVDYDFIDFVRRNKRELNFTYERGEITGGEQMKSVTKDKINPAKMNEEGKCHPQDESTNLFKSYCYELNKENSTIYVIVSNKNKYDLHLKLRSAAHINDSLNEAFHLCIDHLIMRKKWPGISRFLSEYKLDKGDSVRCKGVNLDIVNCGDYSKLKHLSAAYVGKNEKKGDHYYQYVSNILREKREYCFGLRSNFFVDSVQFENVLSSMKCSFIKLHLHADNVNLYEDKIMLNLSKSERIFKIFIASHMKSLHLLSPHRETKNGDKCIFVNSLFINKEIFKKFEEISRNEKNEEVDKICKCFEEILKPREIDIFNSSNLRKRVHYTFSKIYHIRHDKGGRGIKGVAEAEASPQSACKGGKRSDEGSNEKYENRSGDGDTTEDPSHSSDAADIADITDMNDEGSEIRIECANKYMDKKEKAKVKLFLENVLHKEGKHLYKIDCNYSYANPMDSTSEVKIETACDVLNEKLKNLLSLQFYLSVNVERPRITLLHNSKISYGKRIKFDLNYFNKKAYKRIDKMYKSQVINDILYEDVNEVNEYFDQTFLKNKNLKLYFCNQQQIPFYAYIYTKKFLQIKNVYIGHEEFDHSNTKIYYIKSKGKVCVKLEVDELKLKNELKNNPSRNMPTKSAIDKKYIQEDFLTFQYLTSKRQQRFCVECHYSVPFLIIKENQHIFREFNNLKKKNQKIENCRELNEIESNLSDKIKAGKIIYSEIEMRNSAYFISISFSELKMYKLCLFLFNTTRFPATWAVKEDDPHSNNSYSLKGADNKVFHFSKTKDILFGKTYDMHDVNLGKDENWNNPFLFPDYIIVTFTPTNKSDVTKKYCIDVTDGEKIDFYLKGVYIPKNDEQTKNS